MAGQLQPHPTCHGRKPQGTGSCEGCPLHPAAPAPYCPQDGTKSLAGCSRGDLLQESCSEPSQPHLAPTEDIWQLLIPLDFQQYLMNPQMFSPFAQWPELPGALFLQIPQVKGCLPAASPAQAAART